MARKTKTQQYLDMDWATFNRMNKQDLQRAVITLSRTANKQIREFQKAGETSPAVQYALSSGGLFTSWGKSLNELRSEFVRERGFLTAETSKLEDWKSVKETTIESLSNAGVDVEEDEYDTMWKAYEKLKERNPEVAMKEMKYKVLNEISNLATDKRRTPSSIARRLSSELEEIYRKEELLNDDGKGVSRFIKLE